jgi:signal transduction histidine kinase
VRTSLSLPTLRVILAGLFVLVLAVAGAAGWALAGSLLALAATTWWVVHRHAVALRSQRAQLERHEARWQEVSIEHERFVDNLAHEIRTPLSIVLNEAELIFAGSDDRAVVKRHARSIADYVLHLAALCDGFLRLAGPFVKGDTSGHVPVHLHDAVLEAVGRSQATASGRGVSVVTTLAESGDEDAALEVLGNPVLLAAMIETVVRNAVRAAARGTKVGLRCSVRGESIVLLVRDHGAGIAQAQLASAFDWVCRAPGGPPEATGPGVGLAIARCIAEHHRGTISLQNHPDGGCEFEISLPRWRVAGQSIDRPAAHVPRSAARPA